MTKIFCRYCKEPIVYGDARNSWLDYHGVWYHRLYWSVKNRITS